MEGDLGDVVDAELKMSQQHALAAKQAARIPGCTKHSTGPWWKGVTAPLHTALVQPHL